ncbi:MAG: helix-turn-helix transcriptional regulator [Actinobacteria bacterium]|nr:helix-turn-helix transcriptional regulator [Actinomycetota bacterium]
MSIVRDLRESAELTQVELAERAGTSQPAIAAYESDRKSPTLRTLRRLAQAAGREVVVSFAPPLTREERRSLALHRAIARKLREVPDEVLVRARRNLARMMERHPAARGLLEEWAVILERPVDEIVEILTDPRPHARELRHVTPFARVLTAAERTRVYEEFARSEALR